MNESVHLQTDYADLEELDPRVGLGILLVIQSHFYQEVLHSLSCYVIYYSLKLCSMGCATEARITVNKIVICSVTHKTGSSLNKNLCTLQPFSVLITLA